jgi:broad specificity phosphatase PhoE
MRRFRRSSKKFSTAGEVCQTAEERDLPLQPPAGNVVGIVILGVIPGRASLWPANRQVFRACFGPVSGRHGQVFFWHNGRVVKVTRLILVRHGETEANVDGIWHGSADAPLTERGKAQVEAVARRLAELHVQVPVEAFYTSGLPRARSTAAAVANIIGVQPVIEDGLREFSIGDWEGRSFLELREQENLWGRWRDDPAFAPPNGESAQAFARRAILVLRQLAERHPDQTVLVVTHGGLISSALAQWLGGGSWDWVRWDPHNCSITILAWNGERWIGEQVNDIDHLPPEVLAAPGGDEWLE